MREKLLILVLAVGLMAIAAIVVSESGQSVRNVNSAQCSRVYNLPAGERVVGVTEREILTTISNTEPKTYRLRSFRANYCSTIQER